MKKIFIYPSLNDEFNSVIISSLMAYQCKKKYRDFKTVAYCFNKSHEIIYQLCDEVIVGDLEYAPEILDKGGVVQDEFNNSRELQINEFAKGFDEVYEYKKEISVHPYEFIFKTTCEIIRETDLYLKSSYQVNDHYDYVFLNRNYKQEKNMGRNADFSDTIKSLNDRGIRTLSFVNYKSSYKHELNTEKLYGCYNEQLAYMERAKFVFSPSNAGGISTHILSKSNLYCLRGIDEFADGARKEYMYKGKNLKDTREECWGDVRTVFSKDINIETIL
jgi:hypothetical protein